MKVQQALWSYNSPNPPTLPNPKDWDSPQTLILAFCSPHQASAAEAVKSLNSKYPKSTIVGCSTAGDILGNEVHDNSIALSFTQLEQGSFKVVSHPINSPDDSVAAGEALAKMLDGDELKGVFIVSDGLNANGSLLAQGFNTVFGSHIPLGGGLAGDGTNFISTFIVHNGEVKPNHIMAIGFYGSSIEIHSGSQGGWDIFGPERTITKSTNNVLYEVGGKPALALYKEYLGDKAADLPASGLLFPLQISPPDNPSLKLVRTILAIDEEAQSLTFAGDVPTGWMGQLMRANFDRVIDASGEAYGRLSAPKNFTGSELVIAISCVGRRLVLGERTEEELEVICDQFEGSNHYLTGFYSYGELAPSQEGKPCELHNQTMTMFSISEKHAGEGKKVA